MSRSYKKCPGYKDVSKWAKNQANRRVRRYSRFLPNGGKYKTLYEQWNITDWNWRYYTKQQLIDHCESWGIKPYKLTRK